MIKRLEKIKAAGLVILLLALLFSLSNTVRGHANNPRVPDRTYNYINQKYRYCETEPFKFKRRWEPDVGTITYCGQQPVVLTITISETISFEISHTLGKEIAIEFGIDPVGVGWKEQTAELFGVKVGFGQSREYCVQRQRERCYDQIIWTRDHGSWYSIILQKKKQPLWGEPRWKDAGGVPVIRDKCKIDFGYMKIYNSSCEGCPMRPTRDNLIITQPEDMPWSLLFLKLYARWLINRNENPSEHILAKLRDEPRQSWFDFVEETFKLL